MAAPRTGAMYPLASRSTCPATSFVFGVCPMATKTPSTARSLTAPVRTLRRTTPVTTPFSTSRISSTTVSSSKAILGLARAFSCMIFDARNAPRRCTMVTSDANFVRNVASSIAESPPPTTTIGLPRKKKPSHVAQVDTPCPISARSDSSPSSRADAPVARISARVSWTPPLVVIRNGGRRRSRAVTSPCTISVPKRSACARISPIRTGPRMPSRNPG